MSANIITELVKHKNKGIRLKAAIREQLGKGAVSANQVLILHYLHEKNQRVADIAIFLGLSQQAVGKALKRMEELSLVKRRCGVDKRERVCNSTARGKKIIEKLTGD